jgi:ferredoxin
MATLPARRTLSRLPRLVGRDLLHAPLLGAFLRWRHARSAAQSLTLILAALILYDGFFGPQLAPQNLAGTLPWVHWRGLVVVALLLAGNIFCMACPFMVPRQLAKRLFPANRPWPAWLRGKWIAIALLLLFFWSYEAFDLWANPWLTAWVVVAYFAGAFAIDAIFQGSAFCKYVCPIGQFNFVNALVSPLEVAVRDRAICAGCITKDCISGRHAPPATAPLIQIARRPTRPTATAWLALEQVAVPLAAAPASTARGRLTQRGCELWLFQEQKVGNMDCTFCLDCVKACPHDNVGVLTRVPTAELWADPRRAGIGQFGQRRDLAALTLVLVFGAFLNAFGMVKPVYGFERWLGTLLHIGAEPVLLAIIFGIGMIVLPVILIGLAAAAGRALTHGADSLTTVALRYCYTLVPLGLGMWLAHYGYHLLTGGLTIIPLAQQFCADLGFPLLGHPNWAIAGLIPADWTWLTPIAVVALQCGAFGSLLALGRIAGRQHRERRMARRAALPWAILIVALCCAGIWLMMQPMEMRGSAFMQ